MAMKVFIGSDHRGFELKGQLKIWLESNGYEAEDCGAFEYNKDDDFVDFAIDVSRKVSSEEGSRGVLICGSGAGVEITANKNKGIRCALGLNPEQIMHVRQADDANTLALASDYTGREQAEQIVKAFLETEFDPAERHQRRLEKIRNLE